MTKRSLPWTNPQRHSWTGKDETVYDSRQEREQYAQHRADAAIPTDICHQPRYDITADLIERAVYVDIEHVCVLGDSEKATARFKFRSYLVQERQKFVFREGESKGVRQITDVRPAG